VPPSAASNAPTRSRSAPVNDPRTCPKQLALDEVRRDAPQSTMTNGLSPRVPALDDLPSRRAPSQCRFLALDEHVDVALGDLLEHREELAHRHVVPASEPKLGIIGTTASRSAAAWRTRTSESPSAITPPSAVRSASRMRTPSSFVPFSEPVFAHAPAAVVAHEATVEAGDRGVGEDEVVEECVPMRQRSPSNTTDARRARRAHARSRA